MTLTAAEQTTLTDIAAAQARGEDPFGDSDDDTTAIKETPPEEVTAANGEASTAESTETTVGVVEGHENGTPAVDPLDEATLSAIANDEQPIGADPLQFNAQVPADYKTARAALLAEKATAMEQLLDATIDAKEFSVIESRVMDSLEDLSVQRIRAETLIEANAQNMASSQQSAISALIARTKDDVDYTGDAEAPRQFNMALQLASAEPANAGKPFAHLVNEAHKVVMALRGVQPKAVVEPRKPGGQAPVTLRSIPAAATSNTGGSITDQMSRLKGREFELAYAKLTPSQRASMLDD